MMFPANREMKLPSVGIRRCCVLALLCAVSVCWAWAANDAPSASPRPYASSNSTQTKAARSGEAGPPAAAQPTVAGHDAGTAREPKPLDAPAKPAIVSLQRGKLTVEANNSDLSQILQKVASISGMKIDGLDKSSRVFGAYGPGNPHEILADLLAGSGYDFMMVGNTADGAPSKLLLTAKNNKAPALNSAISGRAASSNNSGSDRARPSQPQPAASSGPAEPAQSAQSSQTGAEMPDADADADAEPLGPGAVAHPPPPAPDDPQQRMQQNLQRLQEMHKQEQQNAPQ